MQNNQVGGVSNTIDLSTVNGALVYLCARTSTWPSAERRAKYFVYVPSPSSLRRAMYLVYLCACRVKNILYTVLCKRDATHKAALSASGYPR